MDISPLHQNLNSGEPGGPVNSSGGIATLVHINTGTYTSGYIFKLVERKAGIEPSPSLWKPGCLTTAPHLWTCFDETTMEEATKPAPTLSQTITNLTTQLQQTYKARTPSSWILLSINIFFMLTAFPASSILSRIYYSNRGKSKWIISLMSVSGWPLTLFVLIPLFFILKVTPTKLTFRLSLWYICLGFLSAVDNLMYAWAYAYLPASTASLLAASSLVFSSIFGYFIVKNKMGVGAVNAVVVITAGVVVIGLDSGSDRYPGVSDSQYNWGFAWDILGSALHGLIFALSELVFVKVMGRRSFLVVLEQQVMVSLLAMIFTIIGTIISGDFKTMSTEAKNFKNGQLSYIMVLFWSAVTFQLGVLGATAVLFLASTVLAGVVNAVRVPITSIAAVIFLHDPMSGFKILALVLTVWGFGSYIVGSV